MIVLWTAIALGGQVPAGLLPTTASPADEPWAGIPIDNTPSLGLREVVFDARSDSWQAGYASGFVRTWILPDDETARRTLAFQSHAATTIQLATAHVDGADEALGDDSLVLTRSRNIVLLVRDPDHHATLEARQLLGALVQQAPSGTKTLQIAGQPVTVDACGRHVH